MTRGSEQQTVTPYRKSKYLIWVLEFLCHNWCQVLPLLATCLLELPDYPGSPFLCTLLREQVRAEELLKPVLLLEMLLTEAQSWGDTWSITCKLFDCCPQYWQPSDLCSTWWAGGQKTSWPSASEFQGVVIIFFSNTPEFCSLQVFSAITVWLAGWKGIDVGFD